MRTIDTLIQQALMMQELDHAVGDTVMIKGWYADLSVGEQELFNQWLSDTTKEIMQVVGRDNLVEIGQGVMGGLAESLTH